MPARRTLLALVVLLVPAGALASSAVLGSSGVARAVPEEAAPGVAPEAPEAGVFVQGVGTARGTPDVVRIAVGVETTEATVGEAVAAAGDAAARVLDALRREGVAAEDVQTAALQLHPSFEHEEGRATGYVARQDLTVIVRRVEEAGAVVGAAVEAAGDAARLQGLSYGLADDAALQAEARDRAFAAARRKAEQYATLAGRQLGAVLAIREQVAAPGPGPVFAEDMAGGERAMPLAAGATEVTVTVEVRWSLQ